MKKLSEAQAVALAEKFIGMILSGAASVDAVPASGANGAGVSGAAFAASARPEGEGVESGYSADSQGDEAAGDYVASLLSSPKPPALGAWSAVSVAKLLDGEAGGERAEKGSGRRERLGLG